MIFEEAETSGQCDHCPAPAVAVVRLQGTLAFRHACREHLHLLPATRLDLCRRREQDAAADRQE